MNFQPRVSETFAPVPRTSNSAESAYSHGTVFPPTETPFASNAPVGIVFNGKKLYGIYDFFRRGACAGVELRDRLRKIAVFCVQSKQLRAAF